MHVPPQQLVSADLSADGTITKQVQLENYIKDLDLLSCIRGSPQSEKILLILSDAVVQGSENKLKKSSSNVSCILPYQANEEESFGIANRSVNFVERDHIVQEAYLNELCSFLSGLQISSGVNRLTELPLPKNVNNNFLKELFFKLSRIKYWRNSCLIPLLRRWWHEGDHASPSLLLLQTLTDAIEEEIFTLLSKETCFSVQNDKKNNCEYDKLFDFSGNICEYLIQELIEIVKATSSFRGICLGIDIILRNKIFFILKQAKRIIFKKSGKTDFDLDSDIIQMNLEELIETVISSTWKDLSSFFLKCLDNISLALRESVWTFFIALLSGYLGTLIILERDIPVEREKHFQLQVQQIFLNKLQIDLWDFLRVHLSSDQLTTHESLETVHNVISHQKFFWKATMEVEITLEFLPLEFISMFNIRSWAREQAASMWGSAVRLVQSLTWVQEVTEDILSSNANSNLITSSIIQYRRHLLQEYNEKLISLKPFFFNAIKQPNLRGKNIMEEMEWYTYTVDFFLRTYHPSCFTILSLVKQDDLISFIRQLYALTVNNERKEIRLSIEKIISSETENFKNIEKELINWHTKNVHKRVIKALKEDAPLIMCLLHALYVLFERLGKTNLNICGFFHETLLPTLANLCLDFENNVYNEELDNEEEEEDDAENYYKCQECILTILVSGFIEIPWDLRGIRLRLLLHNSISLNLKNSFSAEEALEKVEKLFAFYYDGRNTLEDIATALCGDLSSDNYLLILSNESELTTIREAMDELLRTETPTHFPAPCGTLILMSIFRTLSFRFLQLRVEWEQQVKLAGEDTRDYLGRQATFCTTRDIIIFQAMIQLVHRMVFGFQLQSRGLLRLWFSYLHYLFTNIVPPLTEDDEIVPLFSNNNNNNNSNNENNNIPQHYFRRSSTESSQGELRAVLGELLADLALMPLLDCEIAKECPSAIEYPVGETKWLKQRHLKSEHILLLQHVLPTAVLEELCFVLRIPMKHNNNNNINLCELNQDRASSCVGKLLDQSFLGVLGVAAFCQRLELFIIPGSITDNHTAELIQTLWSNIEANSALSTM